MGNASPKGEACPDAVRMFQSGFALLLFCRLSPLAEVPVLERVSVAALVVWFTEELHEAAPDRFMRLGLISCSVLTVSLLDLSPSASRSAIESLQRPSWRPRDSVPQRT